MAASDETGSGAVLLSPAERAAEVLFGVVMTLSVIAAMRVGGGDGFDTRDLLAAALGCNLAWGFVDAAMYLLSTLLERARQLRVVAFLRAARDAEELRAALRRETPAGLVDSLPPEVLQHFHRWLRDQPVVPRARLTWDDVRAAVVIWLLVALSTLPLVVPFVWLENPQQAVRTSHGIAILMMFALGWRLGGWVGLRPLWSGSASAILGGLIAAACIALGG